MNRDVCIAHLSIHGWTPVREIPSANMGYGVFNADLSWGLRVIGSPVPGAKVRHIDPNRIEPVTWDDINDRVLRMCAEAIADTEKVWVPA